jgi:hypothetical protein
LTYTVVIAILLLWQNDIIWGLFLLRKSDMTEIDKSAFKRNFRKAEKTFGQSHFAYVHSLDKLLYRIRGMQVDRQRVLLCGFDSTSSNIKVLEEFGSGRVTVIQFSDEIESLDDSSFDIVLVNLVFSVDEIEGVFIQLQQKLRIEGVLLFSLFGSMTFSELKQAFGNSHPYHVSSFYDMHDIGDSLVRVGFSAPVMENLPLTVRYRQLSTFFQDLRHTGCVNVLQNRNKFLTGKKVWANMLQRYHQHVDGFYHVTLDFVIGHAWRTERAVNSHEVSISIDQVKRKKKHG